MVKPLVKKTLVMLGIGLLACSYAWAKDSVPKDHPKTKGWKDLFAKDLSNAIVNPGSWVIEDGVLVAKDRTEIWTKDSYSNFVLDFEFKVGKGANSGVFLRPSSIKNILSALEIQLHESTDGSKYGMVGAIYDAKPPSKNMAKPVGEWNRFTVTCQGDKVYLVFNGELVINADLKDWKEAGKNPDGTPNKFKVALKDFPRQGPIGFQGLHGKELAAIWFRNMKIKTLK
jgi:hypothetical protein